MSLTLTQIQNNFKLIGKFIYVSQLADAQILAQQKAVTGAFAQDADADATLYARVTDAVLPLHGGVKSVVSSLNSEKTAAKTAVTNLLRKVVAVDLGLAANASLASVGEALLEEMDSEGGTVAPSGVNPSGFAAYFGTNLGITLPQVGGDAETILESYIDDDVI